MKKLWLLSLLALSAGPGVAQQISGSFDGKWEDCFPNGGTTKVGVQPAGWGASNVYQVMSFKQLVTQGANRDTTVADVDSCYSAHMLNYFCGLGSLGATAPAYITLGDAWNYGDYANLNTENDKSDGGAYGGVEFSYRPDSISLWVKRIHQTEEAKSGTINPEEKATVLLYSWKGSTSSTMRIGLEMAVLGNAHDITMVDRDKDVLGMVTEGVTKSEDFELVATSENYIEGDYAEWTKLTFPINYVTASVPEKLNIVIASADYFNRPNLGVGNTLDVDDVELIYNSQLATLTYDGETIPGFAPDNYEVLDMTSVVYADSLLAYTSNGAGATIETSYNDVLAMLTVTVKGNDHKTNSKNEHTYQIRFKPASVPLTSYYQIPNGDFEGTWTEQKRGGYTEKTPASWNSFYAANTENLGVLGNLAFSMNQVGQLSQDSVAPHSGKYSAKIESTKNMLGTVSNGNLTTGIVYMGSMIASDSTNFNFSDMDNEAGCLPFSGTPDSLKVWVKFVPKVDTLGNASVNAILHTDAGYMDPNGIMSREAEAASRIASAYSEIIPSGEWVSYSIPFAYNGDLITTYEGQKYLLLSFSTNAKPGVGSDDDALYVDDVEVVYNSQLATLTYDGETIPGFAPDNYEVLDLSSVDFEESKLAYTSNGAGATVETSYNDVLAMLTVTVKGNDHKTNSKNEHTYQIRFKPASVPLTSYYQIPNGDFEGTWTEQKRGGYTEKTPASWNSFYAANTENLGMLGNLAFSMNQVGQLSQDSVAPHSGKYSAKIESTKNMLGTVSNGNLTTGIVYMGSMIASDSTNFNFSDMDNEAGCLPFSGTPDSLKVWVKFVPKVDTLGNASVNAILHTDAGYMDPNGIMSREAEAASRIASAYSEIIPSGEWVSYSIPFAYNGDLITTYEGQKYLLLSFSTNAKPGVGSDDDALYVDDVEVVYNSQLATLTYDGETIPGFAVDNYEVLDLSSVDFEESKLAYTSNGAGATVETSYDKEKAVLTLTVKGNDYEVNSENEHIYKVQFKLPVPVGIDGVEAGQHSGTAYDLQGRPTSKDSKGILIINGKKVMKK